MDKKDHLLLAGNVIVIKQNIITKEKKTFVSNNLIVNNGDLFYAEASMGSESWTPGFMRLGIDPASGDIAKGDNDVNSFEAGGNQAIDAGYPQTDDGDSDNTGAGTDIVSWRTSFGTSAANITSLSEIAVVNSSTSPDKAVCHAVFAAPFNKTSDDTLKVFVNHEFLGS